MADFTPQDLSRALLDALREFQSGGRAPEQGGGGQGSRAVGGDVDTKNLQKMMAEVGELADSIKAGRGSVDTFSRVLLGQGVNYQDIGSQLAQFESALADAEKAEDVNARAIIENTRERLVEATVFRNTRAAMTNVVMGATSAISKNLVPALGTFVKGLQSGSTGTELATGLISSSLNAAAGTAQTAGSAAGALGQSMSGMPGKMGAFGKGLAMVGPLFGKLSAAANKLAQFGLQVVGKEVERQSKAFHAGANAGALFADGMTGMTNAALSAGLTTDQFSNVLATQSANLAASGMGVSGGIKLMEGAFKVGGKNMKRELQNLGYGFEEQAGLVAETMANMRQSGGALTQGDQAAIAQQTAKYAENLRVITAITGSDAKKKMEQVKAEANQLAFQQKLAGMDATQRSNIINAMANMSDQQRKNFQETMVFGQVVNKTGAALEATSTNFAANTQQLVTSAMNGTLDAEKTREINGKFAEGVRQDLLNQKEIGMAGMAGIPGMAADLSQSMAQELNFRQQFNAENIKQAEAAASAQKNTTDTATKALTEAEQAAQELRIGIQKIMMPAVSKMGEVSALALQSVNKMLGSMGVETGMAEPEEKTDWGEVAATAAGDALTGASIGATIGSIVPGVGTAIGAAVGGGAGALIGGLRSFFGWGSKVGGVVEGDESGYLHKLHGRELIVPLDGDTPREGTPGYNKAMELFGNSTAMQGAAATKKSSGGGLSLAATMGSLGAGIGSLFGGSKASATDPEAATKEAMDGSNTASVIGGLLGSVIPGVGPMIGAALGREAESSLGVFKNMLFGNKPEAGEDVSGVAQRSTVIGASQAGRAAQLQALAGPDPTAKQAVQSTQVADSVAEAEETAMRDREIQLNMFTENFGKQLELLTAMIQRLDNIRDNTFEVVDYQRTLAQNTY